MNTPGTFNFPALSSFYFPPDLALSDLDSSSECINPTFLNTDVSTNANLPSASNTFSFEFPSTFSSSAADSSLPGFVPLNNFRRNASSAQPLPGHDASGFQLPINVEHNARENMPPFQSARVASGLKRKANLDENISGPSRKKARTLPIGQELSQTSIIPEEPRVGVRSLQSDIYIYTLSLTSLL